MRALPSWFLPKFNLFVTSECVLSYLTTCHFHVWKRVNLLSNSIYTWTGPAVRRERTELRKVKVFWPPLQAEVRAHRIKINLPDLLAYLFILLFCHLLARNSLSSFRKSHFKSLLHVLLELIQFWRHGLWNCQNIYCEKTKAFKVNLNIFLAWVWYCAYYMHVF